MQKGGGRGVGPVKTDGKWIVYTMHYVLSRIVRLQCINGNDSRRKLYCSPQVLYMVSVPGTKFIGNYSPSANMHILVLHSSY